MEELERKLEYYGSDKARLDLEKEDLRRKLNVNHFTMDID